MSSNVLIREPKRTTDSFSIELHPSIAQQLNRMAARQQTQIALLVNDILEQYLASRSARSDSAAFLLSLAGMFRSGTQDTSENVHSIVTDFLENREKDHGSTH